MRRDYKVLIIDENETQREKTGIILDFLGESSIGVSIAAWQSHFQNPSEYLAVIIGETPNGAAALIEMIMENCSAYANCFIGKYRRAPNTAANFFTTGTSNN